MLYLVPTPVGNLKDITLRALEVLKEVDLILAEDTRTTGKLLHHYEIHTQTRPFHAHNEHRSIEAIISILEEGKRIALVSDAGTPGISDPGFLLVRACHTAAIPVTCLPGATAMVPALVMSGLPCDKFYMEGFLPQKKGRQTRIKALADMPCTTVLYESPHRLIKCLHELIEHCGGQRQAAVIREISKLHEECATGTLESLVANFGARPSIKGEIVIVMAVSNVGK